MGGVATPHDETVFSSFYEILICNASVKFPGHSINIAPYEETNTAMTQATLEKLLIYFQGKSAMEPVGMGKGCPSNEKRNIFSRLFPYRDIDSWVRKVAWRNVFCRDKIR